VIREVEDSFNCQRRHDKSKTIFNPQVLIFAIRGSVLVTEQPRHGRKFILNFRLWVIGVGSAPVVVFERLHLINYLLRDKCGHPSQKNVFTLALSEMFRLSRKSVFKFSKPGSQTTATTMTTALMTTTS
jgi:hypothetical protein